MYPQTTQRVYPSYPSYPPMKHVPPPDKYKAARSPIAHQQSYFNLSSEQFPFSPNDYYELDTTPSHKPSRLPPSPPISPPFHATRPITPPPAAGFQHHTHHRYLPQGPLTPDTIMFPSNAQFHRRGASSPGVRPSGKSRGSADTDIGRASDVSIDLSDLIFEKLDEVINHMDRQIFSGKERDLVLDVDPENQGSDTTSRVSSGTRRFLRSSSVSNVQKTNYFAKVYQYRNCRLPENLPPLHLYISTWPLLCLAAEFSQRAYTRPNPMEKEIHIDGHSQAGTKSMVIKSVPLDNRNLIIFAIRGTKCSSFSDWATNMDSEPAVPHGFLDDTGNLCHAGFLNVARKMVRPIAVRLEQLLHENPARSACSLVVTGHSAGGAVASLLYAHMLSTTLKSELIFLRNRFKRIHCFTFGSPPVSILPLDKPANPKFNKWLFYTIINEGDPVCRAEKPYVRSLVHLYKSTPPQRRHTTSSIPKFPFIGGKDRRRDDQVKTVPMIWESPTPTLTLPGCLIVLRGNRDNPKDQGHVEACLARNEDLAAAVFGDVMMHAMSLYQQRIEILATQAVTAKKSLH
ncbi:hypothetical protein FQN57_005922 [Myotisia sp. PD_48]|nr:hypothetical protein FQN57_005922 [Myotisia sp. PD_48]